MLAGHVCKEYTGVVCYFERQWASVSLKNEVKGEWEVFHVLRVTENSFFSIDVVFVFLLRLSQSK